MKSAASIHTVTDPLTGSGTCLHMLLLGKPQTYSKSKHRTLDSDTQLIMWPSLCTLCVSVLKGCVEQEHTVTFVQ